MKNLLSIFLLVSLSACIVVQPPLPSEPTKADQSPSKPNEVKKDAPQTEPERVREKTVADTIRACKKIQANRDIPITCKTEYIEGKPAMFMGFPTKNVAQDWMSSVTDYVSAPYCVAANRANRQALLVMAIYDEREARIFNCEKNEWSDWFALDQEKEPRTPQNISQAIAACENIQAANDIPVGCKSTYIQGQPALFISFPDRTTLQEYIEPLSKFLGGPFCASANNASRSAFLIFALANTKLARFYSCESGEASDWQSIGGEGV